MGASLRAAVIGLGRMGMHHVRACVDSSDVHLTAVLDERQDWATQASYEYGCDATSNLDSLIGAIDLAVIATPTSTHRDVAMRLLQAGISCLVEKPIAVSTTDADDMIKAAQASNATLCIGHVERFNPAVMALANVLETEATISHFHARRLNLVADRNYDVDCVLDLMIHDLDLLKLFGLDEIHGLDSLDTGGFDHASVSLTARKSTAVRLDVSRNATAQHRDLSLTCGDHTYTLDFGDRSLTCSTGSDAKPIKVHPHDPLRAQLSAFVNVVRGPSSNGKSVGQIASGQDGQDALQLATQVRAELGLL